MAAADCAGVTPYLEVRRLPHGSRRWIAVIAGALLVVPVGALLPGGTSDPVLRAAALLAIVLCAPVLGLAFSQPHEMITVDADAGTITSRRVGELPDPRAQERSWPIAAARAVELEDLGTPVHPEWAVRIAFTDGDALPLKSYPDLDLAQDTVDHLVLLGIAGPSRAQQREAALRAEPPEVWL
jgi:hypothetical protein